MDRNNIIGFGLIFALLMVWSYFNAKQSREQLAHQKIQDSIARVKYKEDSIRQLISKPMVDSTGNVTPAPATLLPKSIFSDSVATPGEYTLENDVMKITLSSFGGKITKAELKNFYKMEETSKKEDTKTPLLLLNNKNNEWNWRLDLTGDRINTKDIVFHTNQPNAASIIFEAKTPDGKSLIQSYTLQPNSYAVDYKIATPGLKNNLKQSVATLEWVNVIEAQEKNTTFEKTYTTSQYKSTDSPVDHLKWGGADQESLTKPVKWISNSQQFFNTSLIAGQNFSNVNLSAEPSSGEGTILNILKTSADLPLDKDETASLKMYIGPNEFKKLKAEGHDLEDQIAFGASILGTVNKYVIRPVFNFLSGFIGNKGIVILLLTFIVKLLLFPLSYKMLHSQSKMSALKPEMAHLKEKFKDDPQAMQMESMKIYREFGVNPLGGCLPMLLQMPIWLALYQFFPASIEFRQSSFLWATDLSSYDVFAKLPFKLPFYGSHVSLFTLIWVVSTLAFTYYSTKDQDFSMNPAMKYMQYFMPLFFLFFFNNSAAGLTAYMSFSNILNIAQTLGGKALLFPESKMKAELHAAKVKPKKKGGFQERLESMMKEQQQKVESKQKQIKK